MASGSSITAPQVLLAGILASGIASVTFVNLAISIAIERDDGGLKRLAGTPMPQLAYFIGKIGMAAVVAVCESIILLTIGVTFYDVHLPHEAWTWFTFAWVFLLGLGACTLLGIAMSSIPRTGKSAAAVVNLPFVALQFISGVFVPFNQIPSGLRTLASVFPLKWMGQGFRSVFLPRAYLNFEPTHSWEHPRVALVLGLWCAGGLVLASTTFRWKGRNNG